eukprot:137448_1
MHRLNNILNHLNQQPSSIESLEPTPCNSFDLTIDNKMLTRKQQQFYEDNGYIVIKNLLNDSDVQKYYNRFDELIADPKKGPSSMIIMRDVALKGLQKKDRKSQRVVTKLQNWSQDNILWQFVKDPRIVSYLESIIGSSIRAHHFMVINKPADPGMLSSRHPLHQDQWYFPFAPSKHIVCAWTALQTINRNNGCLVVVPGSHKNTLFPHAYPSPWNGPVNKAYHGLQLPPDEINKLLGARVHLEMSAGDTVFFHPLLIHGSGANLTNKNRRSISAHYCNPTKVDFIHDGIIPQQARIAKESEEIVKRMIGVSTTYEKIWKSKSRQVQGDVGNFAYKKGSIGFNNDTKQ